MENLLVRKNIRLQGYDYSRAGYYFVTICVKDRHEILGDVVGATVPGRPPSSTYVELSEIGKIVANAIEHSNRNGLLIPKYVIMPNHIHMIVHILPPDAHNGEQNAGDRGRSPLQMLLRNMKAYITKQIGFSPWQRSFHDHIIRDDAEYQKIWRYIDENPAKWTKDCYYNEDNA